jgi:geranylgeranyl reductase family protein
VIEHIDVAIVGGGPAGSSCAWALRHAGARVVVLDAASFPRQKVCAGWVTPRVFAALALDPAEYRAAGLVLQEVDGFKTGIIHGRQMVSTEYSATVSYAVRRFEFDDFLLRRAGVPVMQGTRVTSIRREAGAWRLNERVTARTLVGAGGHFCPVARLLNPAASADGDVVIAKELEVPVDGASCAVDGLTPELMFCRDLDGYGWCIRKQEYVNVGFGRRGSNGFQSHLADFCEWLRMRGVAPREVLDPRRWKGHAYRIRRPGRRVRDDGVLLVGDSAGLAWPESGEGIAPAVESGIAAAHVIATVGTATADEALSTYDRLIAPVAASRWAVPVPAAVSRALMGVPPVARFVLDRWFLRTAA